MPSRAIAAPVVLALVAAASIGPAPASALAVPARVSDFNGDGYGDLAIAAPGEGMGTTQAAGAVSIVYGSATGVTASGDQLLTLSSDSIGDDEHPISPGARFGTALATGDFDRDGYADLAIGGGWNGGTVVIVHGHASGGLYGRQYVDVADLPAMAGMRIGNALASGDIDGDGYADLVIGGRSELQPWMVTVVVLRGSASGITLAGQLVYEAAPDGDAAGYLAEDRNGWPIGTGDFNGDGYDDFAVDRSASTAGGQAGAGAVDVWYGGPSGTPALPRVRLSQATPGIAESPEAGERFGSVLAVGDIDNDGHADLAVGVPYECPNGTGCEAGAIHLVFGSPTGLTGARSQYLHQGSTGVPGSSETGDLFGSTLAAGDTNGDGRADVAIGARKEDVGSIRDAGSVTVLRGAASGITTSGARVITQSTTGVPGTAEAGDRFGTTIAILGVGKSGYRDLVVGSPYENVGSVTDAGIVTVVYGTSSGITGSPAQEWSTNTAGILGTSEALDAFGETIAR